jgi:hypothetical protein
MPSRVPSANFVANEHLKLVDNKGTIIDQIEGVNMGASERERCVTDRLVSTSELAV